MPNAFRASHVAINKQLSDLLAMFSNAKGSFAARLYAMEQHHGAISTSSWDENEDLINHCWEVCFEDEPESIPLIEAWMKYAKDFSELEATFVK